MKCLELFVNIIKSIKEKSCLNKIEYEFKLTKSVIKKINMKKIKIILLKVKIFQLMREMNF